MLERYDKLIAERFGPAINIRNSTVAALRYLTKGAKSVPASEQHEEAPWRTLCCDLTSSGERAPPKYGGGFKYWLMLFGITNDHGQIFTLFG
jgi:hypothetical protein